MAGQPQYAPILEFDVTGMEISENAHPFWKPSLIVAKSSPFHLAAFFEGSGIVWEWIKAWGVTFNVHYHAEGIGYAASEVDLGGVTGTLAVGQNKYGPPTTQFTVPAGRLSPGVYKIACVVTFNGAPGLTGFDSSLIIQVYE